MRPRTCFPITALALVVLVPGTAGAGSRFRLELDERDFVRYAIRHLERADSQDVRRGEGRIDDVAGYHGYEIHPGGRQVQRTIAHPEMLYVPFVFRLPRSTRVDKRERIEETLPWNWRLAPIHAHGHLETRQAPTSKDPHWRLAGAVRFAPREDEGGPGRSYRTLIEGSLTWTATCDTSRGLVTEADYRLQWTTASATADRPEGVAFLDPTERRFRLRARLTLDRVLTHRYAGFQADVDRAVEAGVALLLARQRAGGEWADLDPAGMTALVLLTLLDGGLSPEHEAVERGFAWLLRQQPWAGVGTRNPTYATGLAMMALEARRIPPAERAARQRGERPELARRRLPLLERAFMRKATEALLRGIHPRIGGRAVTTGPATPYRWGYDLTGRTEPGRIAWDHSNTQYAVLGLESAARSGVEVPEAAWIGIATHFLEHQVGDGPAPRRFRLEGPADAAPARRAGKRANGRYAPQGHRPYAPFMRTARSRGWHYRTAARHPGPGVSPAALCYGSMTATGIASLAIAGARIRAAGAKRRRALLAEIDQAIVDGFVALDDMFSVWAHPQYEGWYGYYMYALERAGMLTGVAAFGEHDWYWEGAVQLLSRLRPTTRSRGRHRGWHDHGGEVAGTCFAVLFLKRGTIPVVTPR